MTKILEEIKNMNEYNTLLLQKLAEEKGDIFTAIEVDIAPAASYDSLFHLNDDLSDKLKFSEMTSRLGMVGGRNASDATRRILSKLICNSLAQRLNWIGGNNKRSIQEFPLVLQLVTASVRRDKRFDATTTAFIEDDVKKWLRNSGDRDGGRTKRSRRMEENGH